MKKKEKSIFRTILTAMLMVLGIEILLLVAALGISHVSSQLDQNAVDILKKQVDNRSSYLESILSSDQNLSNLSERINEVTEELIDSGEIDIQNIGTNKEDYLPLMKCINDSMISTMRRRAVTGIFVAFNTEDLDEKGQKDVIPALYIRDLDPDSLPARKNTDLLMERSPVELVKTMGISTDKGWKSNLALSDESTKRIMYPVFQAAYKDHGQLEASDYGHWSTEEYTLDGDNRPAIAYSVPLILSDGTVYGVLGVELLSEYLNTQIPYEELQNEGEGTYILAYTKSSLKDDGIVISGIGGINGKNLSDEEVLRNSELTLYKSSYGDYQLDLMGKRYYISMKPIQLYNRNAPFSDEQWVLLGVVENNQLFSFSRHVLRMLMFTVLMTVVVGVLSSLIVSLRLARPVRKLSSEVEEAQKNNSTSLKFSNTGIRELDQFAGAITQLNKDMVTVSTKFLRIMEMASVELGGFEVRTDTKSVYVTDNFFSMLGMERDPDEILDADSFVKIVKNFESECSYITGSDNAKVYCVKYDDGDVRYVRMEINKEINRCIGLVEDVTKVTRERMSIEYERDYDTLTGLYNRRAFQRESEKLFREHPENTKDLKLMKKYADFAMYQVKRSAKGNIQEFDPDVYNRNASEEQQRKQFRQLIRREELRYYYQPIVSAVTGKIYALEALMHVELSTLKSPEDVVRLAKEEKCLHELERITFFRAAEGYVQLRECGDVRGDELLFIKSIASESISNDECREFNRKYGDLQPQLVLEITEQESLNKKALEKKNMPGFLGAIALDDYGSGYNSEKSLLAISPQYIKVDMAIIRDIDIDPDKQQIVVNIVNYAHQRGMYIVAEGIETSAELEKVLELGVDLLQGYYLARPAAVPGEINSEAIKIIKNRSREV